MERAPLNSWAQMLELVDGNSPGLQHMTKGEHLSIRQVVPASEDVLLNRQLSSPLDLGELGSKADSEKFDPTRHVHIRLSYTLESTVEGHPVPVPVLSSVRVVGLSVLYCELVPRVATGFARNLARRSLVSCRVCTCDSPLRPSRWA